MQLQVRTGNSLITSRSVHRPEGLPVQSSSRIKPSSNSSSSRSGLALRSQLSHSKDCISTNGPWGSVIAAAGARGGSSSSSSSSRGRGDSSRGRGDSSRGRFTGGKRGRGVRGGRWQQQQQQQWGQQQWGQQEPGTTGPPDSQSKLQRQRQQQKSAFDTRSDHKPPPAAAAAVAAGGSSGEQSSTPRDSAADIRQRDPRAEEARFEYESGSEHETDPWGLNDEGSDDESDDDDSGLLMLDESEFKPGSAEASSSSSSSRSVVSDDQAELQSLLDQMRVTAPADLDKDVLDPQLDLELDQDQDQDQDLDLDQDQDIDQDLHQDQDIHQDMDIDQDIDQDLDVGDKDSGYSIEQDHAQDQQQTSPEKKTRPHAAAAAAKGAEQQWRQQQLDQMHEEDSTKYGSYQGANILDGDQLGGSTMGWWTPVGLRKLRQQRQQQQRRAQQLQQQQLQLQQQRQQQQGSKQQDAGAQLSQQQWQQSVRQRLQQRLQERNIAWRQLLQQGSRQQQQQQRQASQAGFSDSTGLTSTGISSAGSESDLDVDEHSDAYEEYSPDEMRANLSGWASDFVSDLRHDGFDMQGDIFDLLRTTATGIVNPAANGGSSSGAAAAAPGRSDGPAKARRASSTARAPHSAAAAAAGAASNQPVYAAGPAAIFNVSPNTRLPAGSSTGSNSSSSRNKHGFRGADQERQQQQTAERQQQQRQQRPTWQRRGYEWQQRQQEIEDEDLRRLDREVVLPGTTLPEMLQQTGMSDWVTAAIEGEDTARKSWGQKVSPGLVPEYEGAHMSLTDPDVYGEQDNIRYDENDVIVLQEVLGVVLQLEQRGTAAAASSSSSGSSRITDLLLAATDLQQLSLLLQRLLPPRTKGPPAVEPQSYAEAMAVAAAAARQAAAAAAIKRPRLTADQLVIAALHWAILLLQLPPRDREEWILHPAQIQLVEQCDKRAAAAVDARQQQQHSKEDHGSGNNGAFFSCRQSAALLHALVSGDSPIPVPLLVLLLEQLTGGSSSSVLLDLSPCLTAGTMWSLGVLSQTQDAFDMDDTAKLLSTLTVKFLDSFAQEHNHFHSWSPAAMAAAAAGLNNINDNPPGLLLYHVSDRLLDDNLLDSAPTCSLVLLAAAAGAWAAAAGNAGPAAAGFCYDNTRYNRSDMLRRILACRSGLHNDNVGPATASVITDVIFPADLLDGIARELEVRVTLQLSECQGLLIKILQSRAAGDSAADLSLDIPAVMTAEQRSQLLQSQADIQSGIRQLDQAGAAAAQQFEKALEAAGSSSSDSDAVMEAWSAAAAHWQQQQNLLESQLESIQSVLAQYAESSTSSSSDSAAAGNSANGSSSSSSSGGSCSSSSSGSVGRVYAGIPELFKSQSVDCCVSANDAALVFWAMGMAGLQVDSYFQTCLSLFGDNWPTLLTPTRTVQLLQGLAAVQTAPAELMIKILEMFEERGVSIWVPWHMTPQRLLGLCGSMAQLQLTPGEATVYSWVKAATSIMEEYDPDELAAQCLVFAQLGFTHSTFLSNVAYLAPEFVPHCGPRGLADLALAFSKYRLDVHELYPSLLQSTIIQLAAFNEYELVRLIDGLSGRAGLDMTQLIMAVQEMLLQQRQQRQQLDASSNGSSLSFAPGPLAAIRLLQILPLCSVNNNNNSSSSREVQGGSSLDSHRCHDLVSLLLPQLVGIPLLLPVDELYGLLQGLASVPGLRLLLPGSSTQQRQQQQQQQHLESVTQDICTAVVIRATELTAVTYIDTLTALLLLLGVKQAPAAAAAAKAKGSSSSSRWLYSITAQMLRLLNTHIQAGGLLALLSGTVSLDELDKCAHYPAKALRVMTDMVYLQQQQQRELDPAAAAAAVPSAAVLQACLAAAQELLPHMSGHNIAELIVDLAKLKMLLLLPAATTAAARAGVEPFSAAAAAVLDAQGNADLALLLELAVRELNVPQRYESVQLQDGLLDDIVEAGGLLGVPEQTLTKLQR